MDLRQGEKVLGQNVVPAVYWIFNFFKVFALIRAATNKMTVTNHQVQGKLGLFGTNEISINLDKVNNIKVHQGIIGKMLNYGYVEVIDGSSEGMMYLSAAPQNLKKIIQNAQDVYKHEQLQNMAKAMNRSA